MLPANRSPITQISVCQTSLKWSSVREFGRFTVCTYPEFAPRLDYSSKVGLSHLICSRFLRSQVAEKPATRREALGRFADSTCN